MAMRQVALRAGTGSQKMQRLVDIVEEAEENERRVLVFSHFPGVLDDSPRFCRARLSDR